MSRLAVAAVLIVPVAVGAGVSFTKHRSNATVMGSACLVVVAFLVVVLGMLELTGNSRPKGQSPQKGQSPPQLGYLQVVLGADGRVSTSKSVVGLWTLILASSLMLLSAVAWFGGLPEGTAFDGDWNAYLLLLGGPAAAAVLSKGIVAGKVATAPDSKSVLASRSATALPSTVVVNGSPHSADLLCDDSGAPNLVDTQYVVFSLVAIVYFVGALVRNCVLFAQSAASAAPPVLALPDVPSSLLGLTSLAAATYVGNKAVQNQGLRAISLSPNPAGPGSEVTAALVNLPTTATQANTVVLIGAGDQQQTQAPSSVDSASARVTFVAPSQPGTYPVSIVAPDTSAGPLTLTVA